MKTLKPAVSPHGWIDVGAFEAVICSARKNPDIYEVVYFDGGLPISNFVEWTNEGWTLAHKSGNYARNKPDLADYVATLRAGRHRA